MAVVAPPPIRTKLDFWGPADSAVYPLETPEPMTSIMSYQYPPPPPPNGAEMEMPHSGYMPNYSVPPHHPDHRQPHESSMSLKDRKDSFSQASMKLKRSLSTPNVRPPQAAGPDPSMGLSGEKRRNKLGYHRTSVACGHCRRRKIRCIPSPADVQGRCVNCIRLKKECSFYPVDQQPPADVRTKAPSRASTGPKVPSASSSPAIPSGHPSEMPQHQPYPPLAMPPIQNMAPPAMKPPGADNFSPETKMPSSASSTGRPFDFAAQPMTNWMSAEPSPGSTSKPGDLNNTWRSYPHESPITPAFSPYTPHAPPPSATWASPVTTESSSREELPWSNYPPPPPRSMSFGGESMSSHQPGQYPPIQNSRPYERKSTSEMYPPPIATTIPGIENVSAGSSMDHNVSLSAGAVPPPSYGNWQQPSYSSYAKPGENYNGWSYGENGSAQQMPAEQVPPPSENPPTSASMYYSSDR